MTIKPNVEISVHHDSLFFYYQPPHNPQMFYECFNFVPHNPPGWVVLGWVTHDDDIECVESYEFGDDQNAALLKFAEIVKLCTNGE